MYFSFPKSTNETILGFHGPVLGLTLLEMLSGSVVHVRPPVPIDSQFLHLWLAMVPVRIIGLQVIWMYANTPLLVISFYCKYIL